MNGICTPIKTVSVSVANGDSSTSITFYEGQELTFYTDMKHEDRVVVDNERDISYSLSVMKFYSLFKIVKRGK